MLLVFLRSTRSTGYSRAAERLGDRAGGSRTVRVARKRSEVRPQRRNVGDDDAVDAARDRIASASALKAVGGGEVMERAVLGTPPPSAMVPPD